MMWAVLFPFLLLSGLSPPQRGATTLRRSSSSPPPPSSAATLPPTPACLVDPHEAATWRSLGLPQLVERLASCARTAPGRSLLLSPELELARSAEEAREQYGAVAECLALLRPPSPTRQVSSSGSSADASSSTSSYSSSSSSSEKEEAVVEVPGPPPLEQSELAIAGIVAAAERNETLSCDDIAAVSEAVETSGTVGGRTHTVSVAAASVVTECTCEW